MNWNKYVKNNQKNTFIVKPEHSWQGKGIYLTKNVDNLNNTSSWIVQKYIDNPLLIDNLKFDLRIYVLLFGIEPLRIYMYKDGIARFGTEEYDVPDIANINNRFMHLTNYAINKNNAGFNTVNQYDIEWRGHKRSLHSIWALLNEEVGVEYWEWLQRKIKSIIVKTLITVKNHLRHIYRSWQPDDMENSLWFEILGFDILIDDNLEPYLLEINQAPSFSTDTPLDLQVKHDLIEDTFKLLNLSVKRKCDYKVEQLLTTQRRIFTGKKEKFTAEERKEIVAKIDRERHEFETKNLGGYELLYSEQIPDHCKKYARFIKDAEYVYEQFSTGNKYKKKLEEQTEAAKNTKHPPKFRQMNM